jgi:hypothetical protein
LSDKPLFTLEPGGWYAMTMYPGYTDEPYRSPVEVHAFRPLGLRRFELTFYNVGYAAGVQMMEKTFRILHRHEGSLITLETLVDHRTTIFEPLTTAWVSAFTPGFGAMMIDALLRRRELGFYQPI